MLHEERNPNQLVHEPDLGRCNALIDFIGYSCPLTIEDDMPSALVDNVITQINALSMTMDEYTLLDEQPEQFGGVENQGWHLVIRAPGRVGGGRRGRRAAAATVLPHRRPSRGDPGT